MIFNNKVTKLLAVLFTPSFIIGNNKKIYHNKPNAFKVSPLKPHLLLFFNVQQSEPFKPPEKKDREDIIQLTDSSSMIWIHLVCNKVLCKADGLLSEVSFTSALTDFIVFTGLFNIAWGKECVPTMNAMNSHNMQMNSSCR